jgi:hypothetical protein
VYMSETYFQGRTETVEQEGEEDDCSSLVKGRRGLVEVVKDRRDDETHHTVGKQLEDCQTWIGSETLESSTQA